MKNILSLFLLFAFTLSSYSQLNSNYERGYKDGYCKAKKEDKGQYTTCATSPRAPRPKVGKSSYSYGVIDGYQRYKNGGKNSSQNALINGAKAIGNSKRFVDYGKIAEKSFSNNYSSSTTNNSNSSNGISTINKKSYNIRRQNRTLKMIQNYIRKSEKKLFKYGYLNKDCNTYTDINCQWVLKEKYKNSRKKYKFEEALMNWKSNVNLYNRQIIAIGNQ